MRNQSPVPQTSAQDDEFLTDVLHGLRQGQKAIPPKYFYDARGSQLFDLICTTPEYYPTRTETGILEQYGAEMAQLCGTSCVLIELGSGSAVKTPLLLRHLDHDAVYVPIDICEPWLLQSTRQLRSMFPALRMQPVCADYMQLPSLKLDAHAGQRRVVFFPGSTIGNCMPDEAVQLLRHAAQLTGRNGAMLVGVDCRKPVQILNAAYNDASGHTAAFNLNLLARIQRELDAELNPDGFEHRAFYNEALGRIEMHLVSKHAQQVRVDGETFQFAPGETIHTENSYKYSAQEFRDLARAAGWQAQALWADAGGLFNVHCLKLA